MEECTSAVTAFVRLLQSADRSIHDGTRAIRWTLAALSHSSPATVVSEGAPVSQATPDPTPHVVATLIDGVEAMEKLSRVPRQFSDATLRYMKTLAERRGHGGITNIQLSAVNGAPDATPRVVQVTQRIVAAIEDAVGGRYSALGSVEGRLEGIDIHGRPRFDVYEPVHGDKVRCFFADAKVFEQAKLALGARVLVIGEVITNRRGHPVSVTVSRIEVMRKREELPQRLVDILGPGESLTPSGIESSRFIRDRWGDNEDEDE